MDLLIAIKNYCEKLIEYGYYPKTKKPSVGKLEKMADLCMAGKIRKLSRYIPNDAKAEEKETLESLLEKIKEIVKNERRNV
jgi:hypothetical protein